MESVTGRTAVDIEDPLDLKFTHVYNHHKMHFRIIDWT